MSFQIPTNDVLNKQIDQLAEYFVAELPGDGEPHFIAFRDMQNKDDDWILKTNDVLCDILSFPEVPGHKFTFQRDKDSHYTSFPRAVGQQANSPTFTCSCTTRRLPLEWLFHWGTTRGSPGQLRTMWEHLSAATEGNATVTIGSVQRSKVKYVYTAFSPGYPLLRELGITRSLTDYWTGIRFGLSGKAKLISVSRVKSKAVSDLHLQLNKDAARPGVVSYEVEDSSETSFAPSLPYMVSDMLQWVENSKLRGMKDLVAAKEELDLLLSSVSIFEQKRDEIEAKILKSVLK